MRRAIHGAIMDAVRHRYCKKSKSKEERADENRKCDHLASFTFVQSAYDTENRLTLKHPCLTHVVSKQTEVQRTPNTLFASPSRHWASRHWASSVYGDSPGKSPMERPQTKRSTFTEKLYPTWCHATVRPVDNHRRTPCTSTLQLTFHPAMPHVKRRSQPIEP